MSTAAELHVSSCVFIEEEVRRGRLRLESEKS